MGIMKTRHVSSRATGGGTHSTRTIRQREQDINKEVIDWLRDAYALERGLEGALKKHADNDDLSPEVRRRAAAHLKETQRHAKEVQAALKSLGSDVSSLKTGLGKIALAAKGLGTAFAGDERIKDLLDAYSMEHFEIACYTALAAASEKANLPQVTQMCRRILEDEERMAEALIDAIPTEVTSFILVEA